ncbi:MAG: hypothetical protein HUJ98_14645, partial [Bacteroidaceae bacterium]|nr:hypothetical protein [Bacteroidaceae bacterium]
MDDLTISVRTELEADTSDFDRQLKVSSKEVDDLADKLKAISKLTSGFNLTNNNKAMSTQSGQSLKAMLSQLSADTMTSTEFDSLSEAIAQTKLEMAQLPKPTEEVSKALDKVSKSAKKGKGYIATLIGNIPK